MARTTFVTKEPVVLEGFQAILKPGQFGYKLSAVIDADLVENLEEDRTETLKWAESKLKNPKRASLKPEPWEEVSEGKYMVKFSWNEETKPPVVDTEGSPVVDNGTPLYSGSKVKLAFYQKPYILKDGVTYGTSLKLQGIQIVTVNGSAGVDTGDLSDHAVAELFGKTQGFKAGDPNVTVTKTAEVEDDF
jgi:hypothetical protein